MSLFFLNTGWASDAEFLYVARSVVSMMLPAISSDHKRFKADQPEYITDADSGYRHSKPRRLKLRTRFPKTDDARSCLFSM